jgi:hypothetical protein
MSFIQRELDRIGHAIRQAKPAPHYDELYSVQQALLWALDPNSYKSPYDFLVPVSDTPQDSEDCPAGNDHFGFLGSPVPHVSSR